MVKSYMDNPRTIILAVVPCNVDIASQEVLRLAAEADPERVRTMGVLTKPDLAKERAVWDVVLELSNGQRNPLKLGYCALLNRGADDNSSSAEALQPSERAFFRAPPWSSCSATALGSDALRTHLRLLLLSISRREFSHVRAQIEAKHKACADALVALGPSRAGEASQRRHLVRLSARAQDVTKSAVNGHYTGDDGLFQRKPVLRLITKIVQKNESFALSFRDIGHVQQFRKSEQGEDGQDGGDSGETDGDKEPDEERVDYSEDGATGIATGMSKMDIVAHLSNRDLKSAGQGVVPEYPEALQAYGELLDIVAPTKRFPRPKSGPLTGLIRRVFENTRGPKLNTFNGTVLATLFRIITTRWESIILAHVSSAILSVHDYIYNLLLEICPDQTLRGLIWEVMLRDELRARCKAAMEHSVFLVSIERSGLPVTLNHYFNTTVQAKRQDRQFGRMKINAQAITTTIPADTDGNLQSVRRAHFVPLDILEKLTTGVNNSEHICDDLLDTLETYYNLARDRFVDTLCQHVIYHMLLTGPDSPLKILSPNYIMTLTADQLGAIASEDAATLNQRQVLGRQLDSLEEAMKVLRS